MAKSLQEQLLAAGAVDKNRATKLKKAKHKQAKQRARGSVPADEVKISAQQSQAEKIARDRELSRLKQQEVDEKAVVAQVRQLVENNRIEQSGGEIAYSFSDHNIVKKIDVDADQQRRLVQGSLAIARVDGPYELIPAPVARKINERRPETILVLNDGDDPSAPDDDYAAYEIPDDLSW
jgi:uncharacterized protein YaiL (DUF2058 family)